MEIHRKQRDKVITHGKAIWEQLLDNEKFSKEDIGFVLLDEECLAYWDKYLMDYVSVNRPSRIFLLAAPSAQKAIEKIKRDYVRVLYFDMDELIDFSAFYAVFTSGENVIFLALDLPYGRNGSSILGLKGLTLEEIVYTGMMNLGKMKTD